MNHVRVKSGDHNLNSDSTGAPPGCDIAIAIGNVLPASDVVLFFLSLYSPSTFHGAIFSKKLTVRSD